MAGRTLWLALAIVLVGVLAMGGIATPAAGDNSSLEVEVVSSGPGGVGEGSFDSTGKAIGKHECDKEGHLAGGPFAVEYDGFNCGDSSCGPYHSGDNFTGTAADRPVEFGGECHSPDHFPLQNLCSGHYPHS